MNLTPDINEKTWPAGLAHLSILIPGIGFVVPLLLWFWQRKASAYLKFQIVQAFVFQMLQVLFWQVVLLLLSLGLVGVQVINVALNPAGFTQRTVLLKALTAAGAGFVGLNLVYVGIAIWGAVMVFFGQEWKYPWLGKQLARALLSERQINPDFEMRLIAAMNHFALFYGLNGLLVPFLTWIVMRDSSRYLTDQALQALMLQGFSFIFLHLLLIVQAIFAIPLMMVVSSMITHSATLLYSKTLVMLSLISSGFTMLLIVVVIPLLAVFATIAVIRILRNKPYHYPIIGKLMKKQSKRRLATSSEPA